MLLLAENPEIVFLTGDLGFMALEPIRDKLGGRFINCGVAEQNMVSVAAGIAHMHLQPWVYSIAPFVYARPFEQLRNDVCFHNLPVKVVGNGAGYGYGVMGPTHHAIEDCGIVLTLPNMVACIPAFNCDVHVAVDLVSKNHAPTYLRLGLGPNPKSVSVPIFQPWRQLLHGDGPILVVLGSLAGEYIDALSGLEKSKRPNLWVVSMLPIINFMPPNEFIESIVANPRLIVAEEHVERGGLGWELVAFLQSKSIQLKLFRHLFAQKHHYDRYGSQKFLRKQSALDIDSLMSTMGLM